ncbi:flavin reductase family protein [Kribbella ginsengisoli]|uniref:Flavin reductase like domain-containing protein n=1 Tax=Kribbella ginsengisoli TaxID=363865 RepID=A0ABP6YBZ1_9ACTN
MHPQRVSSAVSSAGQISAATIDVSLSATRFPEAAALVAAGVTVIATRARGVDYTMTATSFTPVSFDPPLALICIQRGSTFEQAVRVSRRWAVSVLRDDDTATAISCARRSRVKLDHLEAIAYRRGQATGAALLTSSLVGMEFRTLAEYGAGDHLVVVGRQVGECWRPAGDPPSAPLLRFGHAYGSACRGSSDIAEGVS